MNRARNTFAMVAVVAIFGLIAAASGPLPTWVWALLAVGMVVCVAADVLRQRDSRRV